MKRLFCFIAAALFVSLSISLQAEAACDAARLKEDIQARLELLDEEPVRAIAEIIDLALGGLHDCSDEPHTYEGFEGAQPVLGPVPVSEGLHIITMTTEGSARIDGVALEGCGKELDGLIHNISAGQGIRGAANLVAVESDCVFYLELSKITAPWTLTIAKAP
ncbi:MAG: hypothetical protein OXN88_14590 [Chloroflexota bacterium]|nr:hypothetical protein [Chloroflexota bacterium]